jgi:hypothetical protein
MKTADRWLHFEAVLSMAMTTLLLGVWPGWIALASGLPLAVRGIGMRFFFGFKFPLDHSVLSADAALRVVHGSSKLRTRKERS